MEYAGRLIFMAVVTCYLLARSLGADAAVIERVVYGGTAALGLEFCIASWHKRWASS